MLFKKTSFEYKVKSSGIVVSKEILKPNEWIVYESFYIMNKTEQEIAETLNFKTTEKNRTPGYKQIKNIQKAILIKARKILERNDLDWA